MFASFSVIAAYALAAAVSAQAPAQELGVGDPAPKLVVREFVKGEPVRSLEKGKIYVVEFWATWCGPCRTSIPHLSELQKTYPDVTFIGVSVWENDPKDVKPFVEEMGEKMAYRVAIDAVPEGGAPNDGAMAKNWMEAAGEDGIPSAFIVDQAGRIAWIGHPMAIDKPLAEVVRGTYDLAAAIAARKAEKVREKRIEALEAKLAQAGEKGDLKAMLAAIDEAVAEDPALEPGLASQKFDLLRATSPDSAKAVAYGKRLVDQVLKDDADGLNELAWSIVAPEADRKPDAPLIALAVAAAKRADVLEEGKNPYVADTLAKALFDAGDPVKALEAQERAVRLAKGTPLEGDDGMRERLEQYRKAAAAKQGKGGS